MKTKQPRLYIPPGTLINAVGGSVSVYFQTEKEADDFIDFLQWLTSQTAEQTLTLTLEKRVTQ